MDINFSTAIQMFSIALVPALLGIILHEVAHGYVAFKNGDPTAKIMGRLTINPLPHIDIVGLLVFVLTSISGSFIFGWAKPVPVDPRYFKNPNRGMMQVALAGPLTNIFLALFFGLLLWLILSLMPIENWHDKSWYVFLLSMCQAGVIINFGLAWLNLIPIPPLDGSKILAYFLPHNIAMKYLDIERYGFVILIVLLFTGALGYVLGPLVKGSSIGLLEILGIS